MRSAAGLITRLLPDGTASQIRRITGGRELQTADDLLRAAGNPEIPQIVRILPADTSYQIARAAGKLGFDCTDMLAEIANATTATAAPPATRTTAGTAVRPRHTQHSRACQHQLPAPPLTSQANPEPPSHPVTPASPQRHARLVR